MPLYRIEIGSLEQDVFTIVSRRAFSRDVAISRAAHEFRVAKAAVRAIAVDPEQCRAMEALERSLEGLLFTVRAGWRAGRLVGLDLGEQLCCWGDVSDRQVRLLSPFTHLRYLSLRGNLKVTDSGLSALARLSRVDELILDEMQIGDDCIRYLTDLVRLKTLYLGKGTLRDAKIKRKSNFSDAGIQNLAGLMNLRSVSLTYTNVTGRAFDSFRGFPKMEHLFLEDTPFNDDSMRHTARMPRLRRLDLIGTHVTDRGMAYLSGLRRLETLYLYDTDVTDAGLRALTGLKSLKELWLRGTKVTDEGVEYIKKRLPNCNASRT